MNFHDNGEFKLILLTCNENQTSCCSGEYTFTITLVIEEGVYFIKNKEVEKYVQIDNNASPDYSGSGEIMELWDLDGEDYQKWQLIHDKDGYYKILSVQSGLALCVKSDSTNKDEVALVQESYSDVNRKKWKITKSSSGAYILRPKSGETYTTDWCMCAGDQFLGVTDGLNVEQKVYSDDNSYKDEWLFDEYKITFYGISNVGHDHSSCLKNVKNNLHAANFNSVILKTGAISASDCLADLKNSNIFTSRSHAHIYVESGTTIVASTGIVLNDKDGAEMVALYSHLWSGMPTGSTSIASSDTFNNLHLVLFIACQTAGKDKNGNNLTAVVSSQGAEVAVGFYQNINCIEANKWTVYFYLYLLEGHTVQESVNYASNMFSESSGLKSAVVCGNGNYKISK